MNQQKLSYPLKSHSELATYSLMANHFSSSYSNFTIFIVIFQLLCTYSLFANGCYTSIISFGDSLADTGNLKRLASTPEEHSLHFFYPPYGESFFHMPTGRCSNGRLIIDFIGNLLPRKSGSMLFLHKCSQFILLRLVLSPTYIAKKNKLF
ncbi:SGNH hydrolase-type esterase domain-containing protein [Artemisia annua]|uniref:SGNH hydrolase-type esterase domain-containing protein n=1 Tax=Artemisia annua TaxID=35608 RepID=A0A2U1LX40_ARTAN|nr:SGNH hydrolase-type esterase domain-containing protein [Artemisia annua]